MEVENEAEAGNHVGACNDHGFDLKAQIAVHVEIPQMRIHGGVYDI
jgi:hypothetical protein